MSDALDLAAEWERVAECLTPELLAWAEESTAAFYADLMEKPL